MKTVNLTFSVTVQVNVPQEVSESRLKYAAEQATFDSYSDGRYNFAFETVMSGFVNAASETIERAVGWAAADCIPENDKWKERNALAADMLKGTRAEVLIDKTSLTVEVPK